jgi:phospholipase C
LPKRRARIAAADRRLLLSGGTGLPRRSVDTRLPDPTRLANGPYRLTPGIPYDGYEPNPVHRFFQMRQQFDCSAAAASAANPSGCLADLFAWVEVSVGAGSNGKRKPADFDERSTGEGSAAMGFYDMERGDAPYLKSLADRFASSDNYHQSVMGGTGANHIALGTGDAIWYSDGRGNPAVPPKAQIENPDPQPGTNNFYEQDGYRGGSYVACADRSQPGVAAVLDYLAALPAHPDPKCEPDRYYIVNNYAPGYFGNGTADPGAFVVPPSTVPTIGDALLKKGISFRYYGEGWNAYVQDPGGAMYCNVCNFFQYSTAMMTDAARRVEHLRDVTDLYNDLDDDALPAVSFVKPAPINDGHPASSKLILFEAFLKKLIGKVQIGEPVWRNAVVFVTFDEGGGSYDSGYVQPLDFFGDGTRVPLIAVSPFARKGHVAHSYADHASLLKFIERNWSVPPISNRSRDNLPNPAAGDNPYAPTNGPAIGDLFDLFDFASAAR